MASVHRLDYGSITIDWPVAGAPDAPVVRVRARCICGREFTGTGESFVEADYLLQQALSEHLETVSRKQE